MLFFFESMRLLVIFISVSMFINSIVIVNVVRVGVLVFWFNKNEVVVMVSVERVIFRFWFICISIVFKVLVLCILWVGILVKVMVFNSVRCIDWVMLFVNKIVVMVNKEVWWLMKVSVINLSVMSMLLIISICLNLKVFMIYVVVGFIVKLLVKSYSNSELVFIGE